MGWGKRQGAAAPPPIAPTHSRDWTIMSATAIRAGRAFIELGVKDSATKALRAIGAKFQSMGATLGAIGGSLAAAGSAITAPILASTAAFSAMGDKLDKMSGRTGATVEELSKLSHAAGLSGASIKDVETAMKYLARNGIGPDDLGKVADYLAGIDDPARKAAEAMRLMGRSGTTLLPMLNGGSAGLEAMKKEAEDLGLVMSTADSKSAAALTDQMDRLKKQMAAIAFNVGAALAETLVKLIDYIKPILTATIGWVKNNRALVTTVFAVGAALSAAGVAVAGIGAVLMAAGAAISFIMPLVSAVGAVIAFAFSPVGILIGAAAGAIYYFRDSILELLSPLKAVWVYAVETFGGIADAIKGGDIQLAMKILGLSLQVAWTEILGKLTGAWLAFKEGILTVWNNAVATVKQTWLAAYSAIAKGLAWIYAKITGQDAEQMMKFVAEDQGAAAERYEKDRLDANSALAAETDKRYQEEMAALQEQQALLKANRAAAIGEAKTKAEAASEQRKTDDIKKLNLPTSADKIVAPEAVDASSADAWKRFVDNNNNVAQAQLDALKSIDEKLDGVDLVLNEAEGDS
jgi:hypothetical protein